MRVRAIGAAVALVASAATAGFPAAPAAAAGNGVVVVAEFGPTSSASVKSKFVPCPVNTRVLGGGGTVTLGTDRLHIVGLRADEFMNGFWATAAEIRPGDYTGNWRVRAFAICGPESLFTQHYSQVSVSSSYKYRNAQVQCPSGMRLISVGATINEQYNYVSLDDVAMLSDYRTANVWAVERESGTPYSWTVTAHVVCVNQYALSGMQRMVSSSPYNDLFKDRKRPCPNGKTLFGVGMELNGAGGNALIQGLFPNIAAPPTTINGWVSPDPNGSPNDWSVTLQGMCAFYP